MIRVRVGCLACLALALGANGALSRERSAANPAAGLPRIEQAYADFNDAAGAVALIDAGPVGHPDRSYAGRSRAAWQRIYAASRTRLRGDLPRVPAHGLAAGDARAIEVMRAAVAESSPQPDSLAPRGRCRDAARQLALRPLQKALYACFAELGNHLEFEHRAVSRVAAFELLTRMPEPERRRALFLAFQPLWRALDGHGRAASPYRRMIAMAAAEARRHGSPIDVAARTVGVSGAEVEAWLVRILDTWRRFSGDDELEPWDYRYRGGAAERELAGAIPRAALEPLNQRYYLDLGLDLARAGVIYDLEPRRGKAPLAYTDYVRRGRMRGGLWQPTIVRVSATYERGGLGLLAELVHENGHAAHMLALRTRPAFMDLGDPLFYEAFADVPGWSVYEPAWQQKYLGRSAAAPETLRALYAGVVLDVAWALFDLRMLRDPRADPDAVWTDITSRYLHVKPHPELAWWAVRVQLVNEPGYMVNYGLGAVITADIRQRIAQQLGPFDAGDSRWYGWLSARLLASGEEHETSRLLREFLGRPVSVEALLAQLRRIAAPGAGGAPHAAQPS
ncbi:MAG TPA: hypothetical protein VFK87_05620 [Steroidobacteraceae bacterium]|nr:hypothetical protein [Steroidobacteraceae bacterium]